MVYDTGQAPFPPAQDQFNPSSLPLSQQYPSPTADPTYLSVFAPPPGTAIASSSSTAVATHAPVPLGPELDFKYLHHYLTIVLPLQYRFKIKAMSECIAPLAMSDPEIFKSASCLAALHWSASKYRCLPSLPESPEGMSGDTEAIIAQTMHKNNLDRLRVTTSEKLTDEAVILPALFALSYYLFLGGTSHEWADILALARRCLAAAFAASPEVTGIAPNGSIAHVPGMPKGANGSRSPWQRYKPLICAMVWLDIIGSVSQNRPSRLLPVYRSLLYHPPGAGAWGERRARLRMEKVMGCDDTTVR